ncbi:MAG: response regulator [Ignavibacteriaceae bacterium]|jgi:CheY-like chemotaxis protein
MSEIKKILIADDNSINQQVLGRLLKKLGYEYDAVENGEEAVQRTLLHNYSLIFMDVHMPIMGGVEATKKIKLNCNSNCPIIIALTADSFIGDEEELLAAGMDDYLAKPISKENLEYKLMQWLQKD